MTDIDIGWGVLNTPRRSELTKANQLRWTQVGQLKRTAALLNSLARGYPQLQADNAIYAAITALELEAARINDSYYSFRAAILLERKQQCQLSRNTKSTA